MHRAEVRNGSTGIRRSGDFLILGMNRMGAVAGEWTEAQKIRLLFTKFPQNPKWSNLRQQGADLWANDERAFRPIPVGFAHKFYEFAQNPKAPARSP
jgi:hypothetical protein